MHDDDTIVALATSPLPSARMIVRSSGRQALELARRLGATDLVAGRATAVRLVLPHPQKAQGGQNREAFGVDREGADKAMTLAGPLRLSCTGYCFLAPRSHTGEDVVEYHLPGGPLLARTLVEALVRLGARQAQPGEFSARAFFNGKLRLDEAEGVAAIISAQNDRELSAARRLRAGELAARLEPVMQELADVLALCELGIDFTEEDVVVLEAGEARQRIARLIDELRRLPEDSPRLEQLGQPPRVALAGRPNAGKSTLLNALAGYRRAVSADQPGTTRDALTAEVELAGGRVTLVDLAGIAESPLSAMDAEGRRRALVEAQRADVLVLLREVSDGRPDPPLPRAPELTVHTKIDLLEQGAASGMSEQSPVADTTAGRGGDGIADGAPPLRVSALRGDGMDWLRRRLSEVAFGGHGGAEALALSARHRQQIMLAISALEEAGSQIALRASAARGVNYDPELLALHLREALGALGAIVGTVSPDELLGRIFSRFCIGK